MTFAIHLALIRNFRGNRILTEMILNATFLGCSKCELDFGFEFNKDLLKWPWDRISRFERLTVISFYLDSHIKSLGRDLDPRPLPYQGNALPGWATKALQLKTIGFINNIIWSYNWFHRYTGVIGISSFLDYFCFHYCSQNKNETSCPSS